MAQYYHASQTSYSSGDTIAARPRTSPLATKNQWVDVEFDKAVTTPGPRRTTALFAFDDLGACMAYAGAQGGLAWHYYKVGLGPPVVKAPFTLSSVAIRLTQSDPRLLAVATDYWTPNPAHAWEFWEYLTDFMTVIAEVTDQIPVGPLARPTFRPAVLAAAKLGRDKDRAQRLWP
jgi:hypothetical protein